MPKFPAARHLLTDEDQQLREQIQFATKFRVRLTDNQAEDARGFLQPMIDDGLVAISSDTLELTAKGTPFLRNACMFFDRRLRSQEQRPQVFSQAL
jgi:oxygen-independent coproporphyrinogen-3 oxidase